MYKYLFTLFLFIVLFSPTPCQSVSEKMIEEATITGIVEEANYIWVSTYGYGIWRYSKKDAKWFVYSTKTGNLDDDLFYTVAVSDKYVWAGTSEGFWTLDRKTDKWRKRKFAQGGEWGNWIRSLSYDKKENILWIGRFVNLTRLDVSKQRFYDVDLTQGTDLKSNNIKSIAFDGDSIIWFGSESGVHKYQKKKNYDDKSAWSYINNNGRGFNGEGEAVSVSDFLITSSNIWFATDEFVTRDQPGFNLGGVYRYDRKLKWDRYYDGNGLQANGVFTLERTGNIIWAGLYSFDKDSKKEVGRGVALIDRVTGRIRKMDLNQTDIATAKITATYFDGNYIWIGTDNGLYRIRISNPLAQWSAKK
ncbi:MAG: hypothetical protein K8H86_05990 [Ignavibacteriaceae bacterium]|nr:hypothetical protein [Ignavibacteriaceae bacterium]